MIMGSVRSLADEMDKLGTLINTSLLSLKTIRDTETADREVTVKDEDYRAC